MEIKGILIRKNAETFETVGCIMVDDVVIAASLSMDSLKKYTEGLHYLMLSGHRDYVAQIKNFCESGSHVDERSLQTMLFAIWNEIVNSVEFNMAVISGAVHFAFNTPPETVYHDEEIRKTVDKLCQGALPLTKENEND